MQILDIFVFIFGTMVGSFLNVLIHRLPLGENFVSERSHCPHCQNLIAWYFNIPLLGYLLLRGKCHKCKVGISLRYPIVEMSGGLSALLLFPASLDRPSLILFTIYFAIASLFIVHFFIDLKHQLLLDSLNIVLACLFLGLSIWQNPWQHYVLGAVVGFALPYGMTLLFYFLRGQVGLGGGDIKLFAALGLLLGPQGILQNIFLSCMLGSLIGVALLVFRVIDRRTPIPFGPFILIVSALQIFAPALFNKLNVFSL